MNPLSIPGDVTLNAVRHHFRSDPSRAMLRFTFASPHRLISALTAAPVWSCHDQRQQHKCLHRAGAGQCARRSSVANRKQSFALVIVADTSHCCTPENAEGAFRWMHPAVDELNPGLHALVGTSRRSGLRD
jgi:hypothetical protein